jgi:hypothetical protein
MHLAFPSFSTELAALLLVAVTRSDAVPSCFSSNVCNEPTVASVEGSAVLMMPASTVSCASAGGVFELQTCRTGCSQIRHAVAALQCRSPGPLMCDGHKLIFPTEDYVPPGLRKTAVPES